MTDSAVPAPEFSRPIDIARIGEFELTQDIEATEAERAALVERLGLLALDRLQARVALKRVAGGRALRLSGHLSADVTQACVVTLEPVKNTVETDFVVLFGDASPVDEVVVDAMEEELFEPWPEGPLDVGETVTQELAVSLDPYPRSPGAALESVSTPEEPAEGPVNPFGILKKLKKPRG